MPRIAAALGALALLVFSIGFNTLRFPVVSEMVGGPIAVAPPSQPPRPAAVAQPAQTSQPIEVASQSPADVRPAVPEKPIPLESTAIVSTGVTAAADSPAESNKPLVPVLPASLQAEPDSQEATDPQILRLPPVEQDPSAGANLPASDLPQASVSCYPSTGM